VIRESAWLRSRGVPGPRLPMRKVVDVLRLSAARMSKRKIAASLGVSATAAWDCIGCARCAGLSWPLPEGLTDEALEVRLSGLASAATGCIVSAATCKPAGICRALSIPFASA
jgi:hypothetical protein